MAGNLIEDTGVARSAEGISSGQRCQSAEALAEWRSSEQVENGIPSTSPPYWDTDYDDDGGPKPSELYGKYTWKIEKFSQINKRELRSNAFEVGGYKWYILIYPQGCDVCNHLSLFLCVANHDKLLPGWSHFAQFTIAVVNKDPKKSKHSDTLHRFWKKEHDWGWKKFMELTKVSDGFLDATDTLIIKAQVQVIREKADRPFRCLDCQYRRELVRVYLTNVEQICRRFVEERRGKLVRLIDDKDMWTSFRIFWFGMDRNTKCSMSRERTDVILKVVVKHFFIEKEVTSTLVMDSLYSGLKALEGQTMCKKGRTKLLEAEEMPMPAPIVCVEKDTFVLADDVLTLIERAAMEPLPSKDEKGPQNRTKDGNLGEDFNKDSIERDERRLTELGRRTVEIFILAHIFNQKIEVAYQEAVALKRQEELIREEELAAWLAESYQKAKRGAIEKEKKPKKKQAKQKRNNRKGKDKGKEDKYDAVVPEKQQEENPCDEIKGPVVEEVQAVEEKFDVPEDVSDVSDSVDGAAEVLHLDSEERDASPVSWDTDTSEIHPSTETSGTGAGGLLSVSCGTTEKRSTSVMDDSSSTCSTDSVPVVVVNGPYKGNLNNKCERSSSRGKSERDSACNGSWTSEADGQPSGVASDSVDLIDDTRNSKANDIDSETGALALQDEMSHPEQHHFVKKEEEVTAQQKRSSSNDLIDAGPSEKTVLPSTSRIHPSNLSAAMRSNSEMKNLANGDLAHGKKASPSIVHQPDKAFSPATSQQTTGISKANTQNTSASKLPERPVIQNGSLSRPSSASLVPGPRPVAPVVSMVQTAPLFACSVSAAGRLGPEPSQPTHSYSHQSYRNAILGGSFGSHSSSFAHANSPTSGVNMSLAPAHPPPLVSAPMFLPSISDEVEPTSIPSGFPYGLVNRDVFQNGTQWIDSMRDENRSMFSDPSAVMNGFQNLDLYRSSNSRSHEQFPMQTQASSSGCQSQGVGIDEFPHLDIINDLLEDEQSMGNADSVMLSQSLNYGPQFLNRQFSLPCNSGVPSDLGLSTSSSCRFERTRSYQDGGYQRGYTQHDRIREFVTQATPVAYGNGHIDGVIPGQWQMAGSDLLVGMMPADGETSPYFGSDYSNIACGVNSYPFFRPSNGH